MPKPKAKPVRTSGYRYGTWWTVHNPDVVSDTTGQQAEQSKDSAQELSVAPPSVRSLPIVGHIEWQPNARPSQRFSVVGPKMAKCGELAEAERLAKAGAR